MKNALFILLLFSGFTVVAQQTPYERSNKKETTTYKEAILFYESLAAKHSQAKLLSYGNSDFGEPLHLLVLSKSKTFDPETIRKSNKRILLINNGIHSGEPEGIDASMMLARNLLVENRLPDDVVICIIPIYNIGGSMNRNSTSRANQNGPLEYGFRGNSKNYDLNRDFIKTDSKNSATFQLIFNKWQPEIFVDTHTSNGADYQHVMTLIPTQKDKLNPILSNYLTKTLLPYLYEKMEQNGYPMVPYMSSIGQTPESGIKGYLENARYSTGYANLHNTIGFMPETHMLKEYYLRVDATYKLLQNFINIIQQDFKIIGENKILANKSVAEQKEFPLSWKLNDKEFDSIQFMGFESSMIPSQISGRDRLFYDRKKPYTKMIKEFNKYEPTVIVNSPIAYIIPKAWDKVVTLLKLNNVVLKRLKKDLIIPVESYYIDNFKTTPAAYEGHYIHTETTLKKETHNLQFYAGDYIVYVNQSSNRYIVETLEPQATDSYFNWNFFDSMLGKKEHFSPYIFEETAVELLKKNPSLKKKLDEKKNQDEEFRKNGYAQLEFIYNNSDYSEKTYNRYPIARIIKDIKLDLN